MTILASHIELHCRHIRHLLGVGSGGEHGSQVSWRGVFAAGWRRYVRCIGTWMGQLSFGIYCACPRAGSICNFQVWSSHKGNGYSQNIEQNYIEQSRLYRLLTSLWTSYYGPEWVRVLVVAGKNEC